MGKYGFTNKYIGVLVCPRVWIEIPVSTLQAGRLSGISTDQESAIREVSLAGIS